MSDQPPNGSDATAKTTTISTATRDKNNTMDNVLLITQNLGGIECTGDVVSDDVRAQTQLWIKSVLHFIAAVEKYCFSNKPLDIIAIHLQEVGGKKFNAAFNAYLGSVVMDICPSAAWCSGLLMNNDNDESTFTAIGAVIFVSKRIYDASSILSMRHRTYVPLVDGQSPLKKTESHHFFHGAKFVNADKSRKGFLLTSLRVGFKVINFLNVHNFHDADNSTAVATAPSEYASKRLSGFIEAIESVLPFLAKDDPLYVFGDFNLRLDGSKMRRELGAKFAPAGTPPENVETVIQFGKKAVNAPQEFWNFLDDEGNVEELKRFDSEGIRAMECIASDSGVEFCELPRRFPFTYLRGEAQQQQQQQQQPQQDHHQTQAQGSSGDLDKALLLRKNRRVKTERLPAWCDRVWLNAPGLSLLSNGPLESATTSSMQDSSAGGKPLKKASGVYRYQSTTLGRLDHDAVYFVFTANLLGD